MELAGMTMYKTLVMTILALVGVFCYHKKIVDQEMNKKLSELVLSLFTPVLLFTSFQKDFSKELVTGLMISVLLSAIAFFLIWCICKWVVRKLDKDYAVVELVALMYSNCGFIGIPMAQGIFGAEGVFYMTAYVAMANFLLWSHGVIVMSGKSDILGIICFVAQIRVPQIIEEPMEMIANMNTPMAMMVAGINIAQADLKQVFCHYRLYWLSFVKLIVMPFALVGVFYFVPVSQLVKTIVILATACPAGVTGSLFALRYEKDSVYAAEIFAMTTIISIVTVPFSMLFC